MFDAVDLLNRIEKTEYAYNNSCLCRQGQSIEDRLGSLERILNAIMAIEEGAGIDDLRREYETKGVSAIAIAMILFELGIAGSDMRKEIENNLKDWNYEDYLVFLGYLSDKEQIYSKYETLNSNTQIANAVREKVRKLVRGIYSKDIKSPFEGKGAVYTAITGGQDRLINPEVVNDKWDYYCFTDDHELTSDFWKIIYIDDDMGLDPIRLQRYYKFFMHRVLSDYDYSIYIDGKNQIIGDFEEFIRLYGKDKSMLCFPHPLRQKVEEEIVEVGKLNKADPDFLRQQYDHYLSLGYDGSVPLIEGCCLIRSHHDERLQRVMEDWFKELCEWSYRDQISLGYVCWKNDYRFDLAELVIYDNPYIKEIGHLKKYRIVDR